MIYRFENCVLDTERRELRASDIARAIEPQVFDLLEYLIRNCERVVSRDEIFAAVWHGRIVSESALSTRINAARNAIGDNGAEQRLIQTFRRKGVRFVGAVRIEQRISNTQASPIIIRQRLLTLKAAPAIVVLPFANIGGNLKDEYFADGLTEEFITELSKLGWIHVISRHSSFGYKGKAIELKQIAQKLHVRYVLKGSVRQAGTRARIVLQLVDGATDHRLWVERFDRDIADVLEVQKEIAETIAPTIGDYIFSAEDVRAKVKSPGSLGAWECIIRALSLINTRKKEDVAAASAILRKAIAIDPKFSPAYSLLSFVSTLSVHLGWNSRTTMQPIAMRTAQKALSLDDDEPWGHVALGYATLQLCNQPEAATENLEHGLKLDPTLAIAHYLMALASAYSSDCESAFRHADVSERLASRDLLARGYFGAYDNVRATTCFVAGRYQDGIKFARKAIAQSPRLTPAYRQLVTNCSFAGEIEQATAALQTVKHLAPNIQQWMKESSTAWSRKEDYEKYAEAFRMAGLR